MNTWYFIDGFQKNIVPYYFNRIGEAGINVVLGAGITGGQVRIFLILLSPNVECQKCGVGLVAEDFVDNSVFCAIAPHPREAIFSNPCRGGIFCHLLFFNDPPLWRLRQFVSFLTRQLLALYPALRDG